MRHRYWSVLLAAVALRLGGLSTAVAADNPAACPVAGFRVVRSNGPSTVHQGVYPGISDICFQIRGNESGYWYYGWWRTDWPGAGDAYPAIKTAMNGPKGIRTSFVTRAMPGWQWIDSFVNEGIESMTVDNKTYRVLRFAHEREGIEGNTYHSIITSWREVSTGIILKTVENQISGQSYGPNATWQAVRVERLP